MLKESKIYVPKNEALRVEIIWLYHNIPIVVHGRKWEMIKFVMRNYWWPEVMKDMGKYVESCNMC